MNEVKDEVLAGLPSSMELWTFRARDMEPGALHLRKMLIEYRKKIGYGHSEEILNEDRS